LSNNNNNNNNKSHGKVESRWLGMSLLSARWQSYVDRADTGVGIVAKLAAERKLMKYSNLPTNLIFQPIAVENLGAFSSSSSDWS